MSQLIPGCENCHFHLNLKSCTRCYNLSELTDAKDCWGYRHASQKIELSQGSDCNPAERLPGTFQY